MVSCFGEKARSVGFGHVAGMPRRDIIGPTPPVRQPSTTESATVGEERSGGFFMPYKNPDGSSMTRKQRANYGHRSLRRRIREIKKAV
jgi:hypothetical protein